LALISSEKNKKGDNVAMIGIVPYRESLVKQAIKVLGSTLPRKSHRSQDE
jgi:hypothetical protein